MKRFSLEGVLLALSACVSNSGVVADGADGFRIMASGDTGLTSSAKLTERVYAQASAHCAATGRAVETLDLQTKQARPMGGYPEAILRFRCVSRTEQK